jgi:hypothetical protein
MLLDGMFGAIFILQSIPIRSFYQLHQQHASPNQVALIGAGGLSHQ